MFEMEQTLNLMEFLEACPETFRLAKMNLAVRGISHNLGPKNQSMFEQDFHRGTKMDYIIANRCRAACLNAKGASTAWPLRHTAKTMRSLPGTSASSALRPDAARSFSSDDFVSPSFSDFL